MNDAARGLMFMAAVAGGLAFMAPKQTAPAQKRAEVSQKAAPVAQKSGRPSARTVVIPRPRAPAPIAAPDRRKAAKAKQPRGPTANQCNQMRTVGRAAALSGGPALGYSREQIEWALRRCGL